MEIKALMVGENVMTGTISFNNTKEVTVYFPKPFKRPPKVTLTFITTPPVTNPYVLIVRRNYFTVRFTQPVTCDLDYIATEV